MRQNNQNKRVRGRNRKGPNPLSRSHESNGPDVKIRGTALHIAEKYVQLARDAQSSGDRVIAENYLQHAEHYFRIVAAAQSQSPQNQAQQPSQPQQPREETRDAEPAAAERGGSVMPADAPQPFVDASPGINSKTANGSGHTPEAGADGDSKKGESTSGSDGSADDAPKPRRRVRGTRGRGSRRPVGDNADAEKPAEEPVEAAVDEKSDTPESAEKPATVTEA